MKFYLTVNDEDYIKFNEYHVMNSKSCAGMLWLTRLILPVMAALVIVIMKLAGISIGLLIAECIALAVLTVVWQFKAKKILARSVKTSVEKLKKDGKLPYSPEAEIEFADTELIETTARSVQRWNYDEIRSVGDTQEHIFILIGAMQGMILPKRCLNGKENGLLNVLKEKMHK